MTDPQLTPRMRQVADLIADGLSYSEIGARLGLRKASAKQHCQNARNLLGLRTRDELAAWVLARRAAERESAA